MNKSRLTIIFSILVYHAALQPADRTIDPASSKEIAARIRTVINNFASRPHEDTVISMQYENNTFYGIHQQSQFNINYGELKNLLRKSMNIASKRIVQLVGDSAQFSPEGTAFARTLVKSYFEGDHILEYGFTGYLNDDRKQLDVNSFLNEWVERNPDQAYRVIGNVVGHSVIALEKWGCKVSPLIKHFIVVYNDQGMNDGFTKFGDDITASDHILNAKDNDLLLVLEGGAQSFIQATNVLENGVPVHAVLNLRTEQSKRFFSTAEFFSLITDALQKKPTLSEQEVQNILTNYLKTHEAWDPKRPDAETKAALFAQGSKKFITEKVYKKLLNKVTIINKTPMPYFKFFMDTRQSTQ